MLLEYNLSLGTLNAAEAKIKPFPRGRTKEKSFQDELKKVSSIGRKKSIALSTLEKFQFPKSETFQIAQKSFQESFHISAPTRGRSGTGTRTPEALHNRPKTPYNERKGFWRVRGHPKEERLLQAILEAITRGRATNKRRVP